MTERDKSQSSIIDRINKKIARLEEMDKYWHAKNSLNQLEYIRAQLEALRELKKEVEDDTAGD